MVVITLNTLPLGYRFRPTDEELVDYYLRNKINGNDSDVKVIREIDVCKWEPWDLPDLSVVQSTDLEWFFFCPRDQKYPSGPRLNRATEAGYWKATGKDRKIKNRVSEIGMKKTLVFHKGRAPKGKRTNWVMHEYRTTLSELDGTQPGQSAFVLCRLFKKLDESVENSLCEEVEPALSSPNAVNSSPGYPESEIASDEGGNLSLVSEGQNASTKTERCEDEIFERRLSDIGVPQDCYKYSDHTQGHSIEVMDNEANLPQIDHWASDALTGQEDYKFFSPMSGQMQETMGSLDMDYPTPNDFSNGHNELQFQNEQDPNISDFLNSILNDSEDEFYYGELDVEKSLGLETTKYMNTLSNFNDCIKDNGSYSESDPELVRSQLDAEFEPSCFTPESVNREASIKNESTPRTFASQNSDYYFNYKYIDTPFLTVEDSRVAQSETFTLKESFTPAGAVGTGESATGIRIRTRQPKAESAPTNFVIPQGFAQRRVRMQTKLDIGILDYCSLKCVKSEDENTATVTEEGKSAEDKATTIDQQKLNVSGSHQDATISATPKVTSKSIFVQRSAKKYSSMLANIGVRRSILSPLSMLRRAIVAVIFCVVIAGLWSCFEYQSSVVKFVGELPS